MNEQMSVALFADIRAHAQAAEAALQAATVALSEDVADGHWAAHDVAVTAFLVLFMQAENAGLMAKCQEYLTVVCRG